MAGRNCDKTIIHSKELTQTEMNDEIIHQSLEKQLAEATEEKGDLEKYFGDCDNYRSFESQEVLLKPGRAEARRLTI